MEKIHEPNIEKNSEVISLINDFACNERRVRVQKFLLVPSGFYAAPRGSVHLFSCLTKSRLMRSLVSRIGRRLFLLAGHVIMTAMVIEGKDTE